MDMTDTLEELTELLKSDLEKRPGYKGRLKFDLGDQGVIVIDGSNEPPTVDNVDRETESTICVDEKVMTQLMAGHRTAAAVYQAGDMTIKGDLQVAVDIVPFLGRR